MATEDEDDLHQPFGEGALSRRLEMASFILRDSWYGRVLLWSVTSTLLCRTDFAPLLWRGVWSLTFSTNSSTEVLLGLALASVASLCSHTGVLCVNLILKVEAMALEPYSFLLFSRLVAPKVGRIISFGSWDGRQYVRRVQDIQTTGAVATHDWRHHLERVLLSDILEANGQFDDAFSSKIKLFKTAGDLPGFGSDRHLYSEDGVQEWLHSNAVRGTLAAPPIRLRCALYATGVAAALSPTAVVAFLITVNPILFSLGAASLGLCWCLLSVASFVLAQVQVC